MRTRRVAGLIGLALAGAVTVAALQTSAPAGPGCTAPVVTRWRATSEALPLGRDSVRLVTVTGDSTEVRCRVPVDTLTLPPDTVLVPAPPPPPPPPLPVGPVARATVTCAGRTCTFDASASTGAVTWQWWIGGTVLSTATVWTGTYSVNPDGSARARTFQLAVTDSAGRADTADVVFTVPDVGGGTAVQAVDPQLLGARIVLASGAPLDSLRLGDSVLVCTQAYVLAEPAVVTVPAADRPWCAGAVGSGPRLVTAAEQAAVDAAGFCQPPAVSDPAMARLRPVGRCAAYLVPLQVGGGGWLGMRSGPPGLLERLAARGERGT